MGTFHLIDEHNSSNHVSINPHWLVMVIRYSEPLTSSKFRISVKSEVASGDVSYSDDNSVISKTREPILISNDCVSLSVSLSKSQYTHFLEAVLKPGNVNYLSAIMPGDWVLAWMMNSREAYESVIQKIKTGKPANGFWDGLKFVGRAQDIRKVIVQNPTGMRTIQYNLKAVAFSELDSAQFFDPNLSRNERDIDDYLRNLNIPLEKIFAEAAEKNGVQVGGISINKVIPAFITAFLGTGIRGIGTSSGGLNLAVGSGIASEEAPYAYVIPDALAPILNIKKPSKTSQVYSYADMLEVIQGLQKYEEHDFPRMFYPKGTPSSVTPSDNPTGIVSLNAEDIENQLVTNQHYTNYPLQGTFLPMPTSFNLKSVWNLLSEYLNPVLNEMYTTIKLSPSGRVMPTLVIRQLPFSSTIMEETMREKVTSFYELPRWKADDVLVRGMDIGRSDAARTNYVHIYAQPLRPQDLADITYQISKWPPVADNQDIKRSGLRPHMGTCTATFLTDEPNDWMKIRADFLMGQHLMLNGVCSLIGVTAPISVGDNFEFDNTLYHIESVMHGCSMNPDGTKTFTTQLHLSHGVSASYSERGGEILKTEMNSRINYDKLTSIIEGINKSVNENNKIVKKMKKGELLDFNEELKKKLKSLYLSAEKLSFEKDQFGEQLTGDIKNPDIVFYQGVYDGDNTSYDPGISSLANDSQSKDEK